MLLLLLSLILSTNSGFIQLSKRKQFMSGRPILKNDICEFVSWTEAQGERLSAQHKKMLYELRALEPEEIRKCFGITNCDPMCKNPLESVQNCLRIGCMKYLSVFDYPVFNEKSKRSLNAKSVVFRCINPITSKNKDEIKCEKELPKIPTGNEVIHEFPGFAIFNTSGTHKLSIDDSKETHLPQTKHEHIHLEPAILDIKNNSPNGNITIIQPSQPAEKAPRCVTNCMDDNIEHKTFKLNHNISNIHCESDPIQKSHINLKHLTECVNCNENATHITGQIDELANNNCDGKPLISTNSLCLHNLTCKLPNMKNKKKDILNNISVDQKDNTLEPSEHIINGSFNVPSLTHNFEYKPRTMNLMAPPKNNISPNEKGKVRDIADPSASNSNMLKHIIDASNENLISTCSMPNDQCLTGYGKSIKVFYHPKKYLTYDSNMNTEFQAKTKEQDNVKVRASILIPLNQEPKIILGEDKKKQHINKEQGVKRSASDTDSMDEPNSKNECAAHPQVISESKITKCDDEVAVSKGSTDCSETKKNTLAESHETNVCIPSKTIENCNLNHELSVKCNDPLISKPDGICKDEHNICMEEKGSDCCPSPCTPLKSTLEKTIHATSTCKEPDKTFSKHMDISNNTCTSNNEITTECSTKTTDSQPESCKSPADCTPENINEIVERHELEIRELKSKLEKINMDGKSMIKKKTDMDSCKENCQSNLETIPNKGTCPIKPEISQDVSHVKPDINSDNKTPNDDLSAQLINYIPPASTKYIVVKYANRSFIDSKNNRVIRYDNVNKRIYQTVTVTNTDISTVTKISD